jgi:hypothetical protein
VPTSHVAVLEDQEEVLCARVNTGDDEIDSPNAWLASSNDLATDRDYLVWSSHRPEHSQVSGRFHRTRPWRRFRFRAERSDDSSEQFSRGEFRELADQWHEDTQFLSSPSDIAMHPAYQTIMAKGWAALPYILEDLQEFGGQWYWALHFIVGDKGPQIEPDWTTRQIKAAWFDWGRARGYLK